MQEYAEFVSELHDEEMNEAAYELAAELAGLYEQELARSPGVGGVGGPDAERVVEQHLEPLAQELDRMFEYLEQKWGDREAATLTEQEIDREIDSYRTSTEFNPAFEYLFRRFRRWAKKTVGRAVSLAKRGVRFVGSLALRFLFRRLRRLIRPLLRRVLRYAMRRLPPYLRPAARLLARRLGVMRESQEEEEELETELAGEGTVGVAEIMQEFNEQTANLLYANGEQEQEYEVAEILNESKAPGNDALAELDAAREQFAQQLEQLKQDEDPTPHVEQFVPVALGALRLGMRIIGRRRVVRFLARILARLIVRFVGPQNARPLSRAIVDAGLRMVGLEVSSEDEARAASSAVVATVEEAVRDVAAQPEYVLENQELLEAATLEAFEAAATANLPPVLSEEVYRRYPRFRETSLVIRGAWVMLPLRGRRRYKKYSRVLKAGITPHKAAAVRTFGGETLAEFLEEQVGLAPGDEVQAEVHMYETLPGTTLAEVAEMEQNTEGLGQTEGYEQFHPLTPEAAGVLLGEPGLGREVQDRSLASPLATEAGRRFYYLRFPGRRPLMMPRPHRRPRIRRRSRVRMVLDFRRGQIRIFMYLSEIAAQGLAGRVKQPANIGLATADLMRRLERGTYAALMTGFGRLRIIHEDLMPEQWFSAIRRLPSLALQILRRRVRQWVARVLSDFVRQQSAQIVAAAEDPTEGMTIAITIDSPPGFTHLRRALRGGGFSLSGLRMRGDAPAVSVTVSPGYVGE